VLLILRAESIVLFIAGVLLYLQLNGNAMPCGCCRSFSHRTSR